MPHRPKDRPEYQPKHGAKHGAKPGATREQVDRRERFERARRDSLRPADDTAVLYGWHTVTAALANPAAAISQARRPCCRSGTITNGPPG